MMALETARAEQHRTFSASGKRRGRFPVAADAPTKSPITSCMVRWRGSKTRSSKRWRARSTASAARASSANITCARGRSAAHRRSRYRSSRACSTSRICRLIWKRCQQPSEILGMWVADKTSRLQGEVIKLVGLLDEQRERLLDLTQRAGNPRDRSKPRPAITGSCACWRDRASTITSPTRSIWSFARKTSNSSPSTSSRSKRRCTSSPPCTRRWSSWSRTSSRKPS